MRANPASRLTFSIQDYLKCIYDLSADGQPASTNAIAGRLGVSAASVTGMLQKMAAERPALVAYKKRQGARLTAGGRRAALEVIRHHRLIEAWLVKTLGYSWDEVHGEAEQLEHAMSEELERRISRALGNPARDPHGEPIPSVRLRMPSDKSIPLADLSPGDRAKVQRVGATDGSALRQLDAMGVHIGSILKVMARSPYDQLLTVRVSGQSHAVTLGPALTHDIHVERERR